MSKSFKQPADRTPAEQDEYDIHRFYQRKEKAEAAGKTYKPRFTGNIQRLLEQYPERFAGYGKDKPVIKQVTNKEVEELKAQLAASQASLGYQTRLTENQGEQLRQRDKTIDSYRTQSQHTVSKSELLKVQDLLSSARAEITAIKRNNPEVKRLQENYSLVQEFLRDSDHYKRGGNLWTAARPRED